MASRRRRPPPCCERRRHRSHSRSMIALVTGSYGIHRLASRGRAARARATVRALVRAGDAAATAVIRASSDGTVDLLDDRSVRESPVWDGVTHVFHLAGVTKRPHARPVPRRQRRSHGERARRRRGARRPQPPRVVLVSSQAAAGPASVADAPVREDDPPRPIEAYGQSKLEAEQAVTRYDGRLPVTIVRPAAGLRAARSRLPARVPAGARARSPSTPCRATTASRSCTSRTWWMRCCAPADRPVAVGRTYFVANDAPVSWRELYDEIAAAASAARRVRAPASAVGRRGGRLGAATS